MDWIRYLYTPEISRDICDTAEPIAAAISHVSKKADVLLRHIIPTLPQSSLGDEDIRNASVIADEYLGECVRATARMIDAAKTARRNAGILCIMLDEIISAIEQEPAR